MDKKTNLTRQSLWSKMMNPKYIMVYATVGIFLLMYLFGTIAFGNKGFNTLRTMTTLFVDNAYLGISAVGMTFVLITGGIDLSRLRRMRSRIRRRPARRARRQGRSALS